MQTNSEPLFLSSKSAKICVFFCANLREIKKYFYSWFKTFEVLKTSKVIRWLFSIPQHLEIQTLHSLAGPRGFAEKLQTGTDRRIMGKAADGDALPEFLPAIKRHQLSEHISQSDSVKWIVNLRFQCLSWFKEIAKVVNQGNYTVITPFTSTVIG